MHKETLTKADGRRLVLYARAPFRVEGAPPIPDPGLAGAGPHLRWHPLREEWVAYAPYRQTRTFLPPPEYDPLAPTSDLRHSTELPPGTWEVAVFENRFPSLMAEPPSPPPFIVPSAAASGVCEVVVFTQEARGSLGGLPLERIALLVDVWADRTAELGAREDVAYVMPFENRGVEVGVTLPHPHGQIYAYPFVPPLPAREHDAECRHFERHGTALLAAHLAAERADGRRIVARAEAAVAIVPVCARYPYETWVAPLRSAATLADLAPDERAGLAYVLKTALLKLDGLWDRAMPYIMVLHQAPTDGRPHPESHLHFEIYPAFRSPGRLKYLAGTEIGAGMFANDTVPETTAAELRAVPVSVA